MNDIKNITKAILAVMKDVKGLEKDMNVGSGNYGYKGVSDQSVKEVIGKSMKANGLAIIPTSIEDETQLADWDEAGKRKQSIFTKVRTKYLLIHESGESLEIVGYGHGIDNQDKGAGKATTYALKYALLYTFLVPTGAIDDTDKDHSNELDTPKVTYKPTPKLPENGILCPVHKVQTNIHGGHEITPGKWCGEAQKVMRANIHDSEVN